MDYVNVDLVCSIIDHRASQGIRSVVDWSLLEQLLKEGLLLFWSDRCYFVFLLEYPQEYSNCDKIGLNDLVVFLIPLIDIVSLG